MIPASLLCRMCTDVHFPESEVIMPGYEFDRSNNTLNLGTRRPLPAGVPVGGWGPPRTDDEFARQ